jgi:VIT1/CCC1 family predicted Fe2+/Mn2+ transporter
MPLPLLLPFALSLVPQLGRWLAGEDGARVGTAAADIVATVTGASTPEYAEAALAADPALRGQLTVQLAQIAAEREAAAHAAQLEALRATLADVAGARRQTVQLARAGSPMAYGAPVVSIIVLLAFGGVMWMAMFQPIPRGSEAILNILLGTLATMAVSVVSYWVGSSAGSAEKNRLLAAAQPPFPQQQERRP